MSPRSSRPWRRPAALAAAVAVAMIAFGTWLATGSASAGTLSGALYRDPNSAVVRWVAANPNDSRTQAIRDKIASQPAAHWLANFNPSTIQSEVSTFIGRLLRSRFREKSDQAAHGGQQQLPLPPLQQSSQR